MNRKVSRTPFGPISSVDTSEEQKPAYSIQEVGVPVVIDDRPTGMLVRNTVVKQGARTPIEDVIARSSPAVAQELKDITAEIREGARPIDVHVWRVSRDEQKPQSPQNGL